MQRILLLLFSVLFSVAVSSQNAVDGINIISRPGDSVVVIKQWLHDAVSLSDSDSSKAEEFFFKAIHAAERNKDKALAADAKMKFAEFLFSRQLIHRSFGNYLEAKDIYQKLNAPRELAFATIGVARTQYFRGNYRNSIRNFLEAASLAKQQNLKEMESEASEYLGLLYKVSQNFSVGISYFRRSLDIKNKIGDAKGVVRMAIKLSEMYYDRRKFDSSFFYAGMALEGAESMDLKSEAYHAQLAKSAALIRLQKWDEAEKELLLLDQTGASHKRDVNYFVRYNVTRGNYHLSKKEFEQAKIFYDTALTSPNRNRFPELFSLIYKNMAESYFEIGEYKQAYEYYQQYNDALAGVISNESVRNDLGSIGVLVEADKSRDEIKLLNAENKLKEIQLLRELELREGLQRENALKDSIIMQEKDLKLVVESESRYKSAQLDNEKKLRSAEASKLANGKKIRNLLLIGLVGFIILLGVIFYQYTKQRSKRAIIQKQANELETLMKEIHHRVKNNLQVVSSLLNLQSKYIKDAEAVDAVKDSRNRVLSMALLHQSLYQERGLQAVDVADYIGKLCNNLFSSYNINSGNVKLEKDIKYTTMGLHALVPVGLILNELVTNSLKYAFPDERKGTLKILLKEEDAVLKLQVRDNGVGLPSSFLTASDKSFGFKMIHFFLQKLNGSLRVYNDNGTVAEVLILNYK